MRSRSRTAAWCSPTCRRRRGRPSRCATTFRPNSCAATSVLQRRCVAPSHVMSRQATVSLTKRPIASEARADLFDVASGLPRGQSPRSRSRCSRMRSVPIVPAFSLRREEGARTSVVHGAGAPPLLSPAAERGHAMPYLHPVSRRWRGWQPVFLIKKSMKNSDDRKTMPQRSALPDFTG